MADIALRIKADFAEAERAFNSVASSSESLQKKIADLQKSFAPTQIDKFIERNKVNAAAINATRGSVAAVTAETKGLQREIERLIRAGLSPESEHLEKLRDRYAELSASTIEAGKDQSRFGDIVKGVLAAGVVEKGFRALKDGLFSVVNEARKLEDAEAAFTPLMGGADKAKEMIKALNMAAAETPFRFEDLSNVTKQLLPVMNGDIENTIATLKMLGDTAGGNAQKLDSITRGFTKAMLKGKVDLESLNMIAEAGVPIFSEMAKTMGYNEKQMKQFFKAISSGEVSTDVLVQTFKKMTSEGGLFFNGMIIASKTTSGVLSTLADVGSMVQAAFGQQLLPSIKESAIWLSDIGVSVLKWVNEGDNLTNLIKTVGTLIASTAAGIIAYAAATKVAAIAQVGFSTSAKAMVGSLRALTVALASNPIGLIAVGAAAATFAVLKLSGALDALEPKDRGQQIAERLANIESMAPLAANELKNLEAIVKRNGFAAEYQKNKIAELTAKLSAYRVETKALQKEQKALNKDTLASAEINKNLGKSYEDRAGLFKKSLESIKMTENAHNNSQISDAQKFFQARAELESEDGLKRIEFLKSQQEIIKGMRNLDDQERLNASKAIANQIKAEEQLLLNSRVAFLQMSIGTTSEMLNDLQTVMRNSGKESRKLAIAMKGLAMAEAAINSYLAFTKALASFPPPLNFIAAGITLAAGLAKQAAIASTPIPSAQTGIDYTVPDTRTNKNDRAAVMASPGERVQITPRGESGGDRSVNIQIDSDVIFRVVQKGIDSGRIMLSSRNIGPGVFA